MGEPQSRTLKALIEITNSLLGENGSHAVENLILDSGINSQKPLANRAEMEHQAGRLFDYLTGGNPTFEPVDIAMFLRDYPECAPAIGCQKDPNAAAGFSICDSFGQVLLNTSKHSLNREEFSKVIGGQANEVFSNMMGKNTVGNRVLPQEVNIPVETAGNFLAGAFTEAFPDLNGSMILPKTFTSRFDFNHDHKLNVEELRAAFDEICAHKDKYISAKSPQELQHLDSRSKWKGLE